MPASADIIKRHGQRQSEAFQADKLLRSIVAACLSVRTPEGEANMIGKHVAREVAQWLVHKPEITSTDIRRKASEILENLHPEAAYLYKHHRLII
jgi:transcriptional regulator NrdR family protein